jgi:dienelactone hydrolase
MQISKLIPLIAISFSCLILSNCSNLATKSTKQPMDNLIFESSSISRGDTIEPNINYYFSKPTNSKNYPIVILIGGSTDKAHLASILNFHKYFTQQLAQNNLGAISVDGWGINSNQVNESEFMQHYTRSQILSDYQQVINYLLKHPPIGWNGKLALLGVSEGGPIATQLNEQNQIISATVLWSGAINSSWRDSLWLDMHKIYTSFCLPMKQQITDCNDIASKAKFETRLAKIMANPSAESYFFNMSNKYIADGVKFPSPNYQQLHGAILVVTGVKDTIINSSDIFCHNAQQQGLDINYWRIESMDHSIRKHPQLIDNSFAWLASKLAKPST